MLLFAGLVLTPLLAVIWQQKSLADPGVSRNDGALRNGLFAALTVLPLLLLYTFQDVGHSDYYNYYAGFLRIGAGTDPAWEPASRFLFRAVAVFSGPFWAVLGLFYVLSFGLAAKCVRDRSADFALSFLLFFCLFFTLGFYQLRQFPAAVIVLWAYRYAAEKRPVPYLLCVAAAACFHKSALVMLPAYPLLRMRFRAGFFCAAAAGAALLRFFGRDLTLFLARRFLPAYLGRHELFRGAAADKTEVALLLLFTVLVFLYGPRAARESERDRVMLSAFFLRLLLFFGFRFVPEIDRFLYYLALPNILLIPNLIAREDRRERRIFWAVAVGVVTAALFFVRHRHSDAVFRYRSVF